MSLQAMSEGIDQGYKPRFVSKTQKLLDNMVNETHFFLGASLTFQKGEAVWKQDLSIIDITRPISSTNPLMNPKIPVQSADHAYNLFKKYYKDMWFNKKSVYLRGLADLEKYCDEEY